MKNEKLEFWVQDMIHFLPGLGNTVFSQKNVNPEPSARL